MRPNAIALATKGVLCPIGDTLGGSSGKIYSQMFEKECILPKVRVIKAKFSDDKKELKATYISNGNSKHSSAD